MLDNWGLSTLAQSQQEDIFQILDDGPNNIQSLQQAGCPVTIGPVHGKSHDRPCRPGPTGKQCPHNSVEGAPCEWPNVTRIDDQVY